MHFQTGVNIKIQATSSCLVVYHVLTMIQYPNLGFSSKNSAVYFPLTLTPLDGNYLKKKWEANK